MSYMSKKQLKSSGRQKRDQPHRPLPGGIKKTDLRKLVKVAGLTRYEAIQSLLR